MDVAQQYATYSDNEETERCRDDWQQSRNYWLRRSFALTNAQARIAYNRYRYYSQLLEDSIVGNHDHQY